MNQHVSNFDNDNSLFKVEMLMGGSMEEFSANGEIGGIPDAEAICKLYIGQAMAKEYAL